MALLGSVDVEVEGFVMMYAVRDTEAGKSLGLKLAESREGGIIFLTEEEMREFQRMEIIPTEKKCPDS